ncbi:MAG: 2-hydroxyacid dehydrogenase [Thermodesulfobacteriota bacterium]
MKIFFHNQLNRAWLEKIEALRKEFPPVDFITDQDRFDNEIADADAIVTGELSAELLERLRKLKMIFVPYAGPDALPLDRIKRRNIRVANVHGNAPYVAERAVAMALAYYGKIIDYHNDLKSLQWHGYWATGNVKDSWDSIQERTCAVIGTGAIGRHIAKYLKVFDCRVIGFKRRPLKRLPPFFDEITLDLDRALEQSEVIFITLPLTKDTNGLFSAGVLSRLNGKFLINVGRGEVVDEEGLYRALKGGILKGAAIDVWYVYPDKDGAAATQPSRYPIHELPNVVLSPHLAGFTPQAARLNIEQTIANIRSYLKTGKTLFEVDAESMY